MYKTCAGTDRAHSAADPNWFDQADAQMTELFTTLENINDPSCEEAFEQLQNALDAVRRFKTWDGVI